MLISPSLYFLEVADIYSTSTADIHCQLLGPLRLYTYKLGRRSPARSLVRLCLCAANPRYIIPLLRGRRLRARMFGACRAVTVKFYTCLARLAAASAVSRALSWHSTVQS